jgi:hypothetical protein
MSQDAGSTALIDVPPGDERPVTAGLILYRGQEQLS